MSRVMAQFSVGQLVRHRLFGYRGVIIDVDPQFMVAGGRPSGRRTPGQRPWYHVLVHEQEHQTYVAERNLEPDDEGGPVDHPRVADHFAFLGRDGYARRRQVH